MDVVGALTGLLLFAPVLLGCALWIRYDSPGASLFRQRRLGRRGRSFQILKFRTMFVAPRDPHEQVRSEHADLTRAGRWLRRFKLDELPQLLNVVRGDMSLVGPRPCLPDSVPARDPAHPRFGVRPGLTGLAQVSGNVALSWEERCCFDARYAANVSLRHDLAILGRTLGILLHGDEAGRARPVGCAAPDAAVENPGQDP